jgi:hypothetical protein
MVHVPSLLLMLAAGGAATAQTEWHPLLSPTVPRSRHAMAFDGRGLVVFGGTSTVGSSNYLLAATEIWDGHQWTAAHPPNEPSPRSGHAMASDIMRARVVLFGGFDAANNRLSDTWEWNGVTWSQVLTATSPSPRRLTAMAYDFLRQRTVLFGGESTFGQSVGDTWEWDGLDWSQRSSAIAPLARQGHAMAYDLLRGRIVMFGGENQFTQLQTNAVWEWDGTSWQQFLPPVRPIARHSHAMAFDFSSGKTLVFGGISALAPLAELWGWDGSQWQNLTASTPLQPTGLQLSAMAFDLSHSIAVVFGGQMNGGALSETWEWDGTHWIMPQPLARSSPAMALDPVSGVGILFAYNTWEWRAGAWRMLVPATTPPDRMGAGMAFDAARQRIVMFGGMRPSGSTPMLADTWLWDGLTWSQVTAVVAPPGRSGQSMTFDSVRQEVVLFGGFSGSPTNILLQDTWVWNGSTWTQRFPTNTPPGRTSAGFAFDPARGRAVLVGGTTPWDTWEWDGTNWLQQMPVHLPSGGSASSLAYDPMRRRCVLWCISCNGTWEWDGVDWLQRTTPSPSPQSAAGVLAFDAHTNRVLLHQPLLPATWDYGPVHPATIAPFGTGCAGSAGTPVLRADNGSLPWLGDTLALAVEPVAANAPVLLAIGFSNTTFGGASLPVSLDALGMTGCSLLVSIDEQRLAFSNGARADFALLVPTTTALTGLQFFAQAAVADAAANPAGIVASNALAGSIGSR